jgi:hypothetical protein
VRNGAASERGEREMVRARDLALGLGVAFDLRSVERERVGERVGERVCERVCEQR